MSHRRGAFAVAAAGAVLFAACSSSAHPTSTPASAPATTGRTSTSTSTIARDAPPAIEWTALHNPMLDEPAHAIKDPALVYARGAWHALFSEVDAGGHWRIGMATSPDLRHWSHVTAVPHDATIAGEASPDVVRTPSGAWLVTYQSFPTDHGGGRPKLYYRTTTDFVHFSPPYALGLELHPVPNDRMIDAAVAYTPAGLLLGYKYGSDTQHFEIARSASGALAGPWTLIGRPDIVVYGDTIENYQFLHLHGAWQLLATSNIGDQPFLFTLVGDAASPQGWLHWSAGRMLHVPLEPWNTGSGSTGATYEHANCAFLVDAGPIDGEYYLVDSDSPNKTTFGGEGPAVLALARSRDLVSWSVPP